MRTASRNSKEKFVMLTISNCSTRIIVFYTTTTTCVCITTTVDQFRALTCQEVTPRLQVYVATKEHSTL